MVKLALALLFLASPALAGEVAPFAFNGKTYTADTPLYQLQADSGLTPAQWESQDAALHDALGRKLYRSYTESGGNIYDTYARVDLGNKYHPLLAFYVAWDYSRTPWADWDSGVFTGVRGYAIEVVGSEFVP